MEELKEILMKHYHRYPLMQMEDFIKILYQNTFGPKHLYGDPSPRKILRFLEEELKETNENASTPLYEEIGGEYCRVSLDVLLLHKMTVEELANHFVLSMKKSAERNEESMNSFFRKTEVLMELIEEGLIPLAKESSREFLNSYLASGVLPIHHSPIYEKNYEPHYRVVNKNILGFCFSERV